MSEGEGSAGQQESGCKLGLGLGFGPSSGVISSIHRWFYEVGRQVRCWDDGAHDLSHDPLSLTD